MASFRGLDMGPAVSMQTTARPPQYQEIAYPGTNGVGVNYLGSRGGSTEARGVLAAPTPAGLTALENGFRAPQVGGVMGDLVDTSGYTWGSVLLLEFHPIGEIDQVPGGGFAREYAARFWHLI